MTAKRALITGANSGMGLATTIELAKKGLRSHYGVAEMKKRKYRFRRSEASKQLGFHISYDL